EREPFGRCTRVPRGDGAGRCDVPSRHTTLPDRLPFRWCRHSHPVDGKRIGEIRVPGCLGPDVDAFRTDMAGGFTWRDKPKMSRLLREIVQLACIIEIKHNLLVVFCRAIQLYDDFMSASGIRSWGFSGGDRSRGREFVRMKREQLAILGHPRYHKMFIQPDCHALLLASGAEFHP